MLEPKVLFVAAERLGRAENGLSRDPAASDFRGGVPAGQDAQAARRTSHEQVRFVAADCWPNAGRCSDSTVMAPQGALLLTGPAWFRGEGL